LTYILNPGGAFGVLGDRQGLLLGVSLLAVAAILFTVFRSVRTGYVWPVGLLLGGALGNLADRIRYGKVVDFIDLGFWPVFNLADVAIVAGAALLALAMLRRGGHDRGERVDHA
ncbi:MAG: signal peptidase II, partial [Candidatus Desulforudis sp.]|nr:signal peptidase II [Desulforudis sp.]